MSSYRERYQDFYNGKEWKELRAYKFAQANGLCEECLKKGIVTAGVEIHHIVPIEKDWSKRLDIDNLVCLCHACHDRAHLRISPLQKFNIFWEGLQ